VLSPKGVYIAFSCYGCRSLTLSNIRWRSSPGFINAGGWVRRRQWVRLMMRPAELPSAGNDQNPEDDRDPVWQGNTQEDWMRFRRKLHGIGNDGGRIALWKRWLDDSVSSKDSKKPVKLAIARE
jgi:hypothetical protein